MKKFRLNLFQKIFFILILISVISSSILLLTIIETETKNLEKNFIQENLRFAEIIATTIENTYLIKYFPFEVVKKVSENRDILFWWLVKPNGQIYLANDSSFFGKTINDPSLNTEIPLTKDIIYFKTKEKIKVVVYPVLIKKEKPWVFYLGLSLNSINVLKEKIFFNYLSVFWIVLFLAGIFSFFLAKTIVKPIEILKKTAMKIGKGEFIKTAIKSKDEIGELADVFNKMVDELKEYHTLSEEEKTILEIRVRARTKQLEELNEGLDQQVKEKTSELQKRLDELEKFNKMTIGRELKMAELKKQNKILKKELEELKIKIK